MRKINLLYVITKLELGGAQKQLLSLISSLDSGGFNLFLFTAKEGFLIEEARSIKGLIIGASRFLERPINPLKDILALLEICVFIRKNRIDIVHTHSSKAGIIGRWAARLSGIKAIIHTVHGWPFHDYQPYLLRKIYIWLERISAKFTDLIIVVSERDKENGLANNIAKAEIYRLVRYGIDKKQFQLKDNSIRKELGLSDEEVVVGSVACFKPQKSPEDFVKLASRVTQGFPRARFLLVGDGALRPKIKNLISKYNLDSRVILAGWRRDIPRLLSAMDAFVLTSLWEGLPISVLEAMTASVPVVVTDTGGIKEIVCEGENGYLVKRSDIEEMTDKINMLLKDEALRKCIAEKAGKSLGEEFSIDAMVRDTDALYQELLLLKGNSNAQ
jgi:glycosyltransferase involved in cell wall biosynthesis